MLAAATGARAITLKEAFTALSNIPNITVTTPDYNLPVIGDIVRDGQIAAGYNLDRQQIFASGNAALAILNQVPLAYMINGANNNEVAAFVYSNPAGEGSNEVLIAAMSGYSGTVAFLYGQMDDATRDAIGNAPLEMQGTYLNLEATGLSSDAEFRIHFSKAR